MEWRIGALLWGKVMGQRGQNIKITCVDKDIPLLLFDGRLKIRSRSFFF